jgi:hypothetical protein
VAPSVSRAAAAKAELRETINKDRNSEKPQAFFPPFN